jgi:hypothetical protein
MLILRGRVNQQPAFQFGGYWQANKNCEPTGDPFTFLIEKPPEHGSVCFGRDAVAMHHLVAGSNKKDIEHCGGRSIPGFKVFYQSQAGYSGHDVVQYTVVVHNARQSVLVDLTVLPSESPSKDDFGAPVEEPHQSPGPMPQCSSLVS